MLRHVTLVVGLTVLAVAFAETAKADVLVYEKAVSSLPFQYTAFNFCTNPAENVNVNETIRGFTQIFQTSSGTYHVVVAENFHGTGVGESGTTYIINGHSIRNFELLDAPTFGSTQTILFNTRETMIGQGGTPDLVFTFQTKETFNADGTLTAEHTAGGFACSG